MPVQIDMEMPEDCEVCPASQWAGAYCREDSTFCPLLTEHHEKDGKRNPNCPLIKTEDSTWHVVADGDLPVRPLTLIPECMPGYEAMKRCMLLLASCDAIVMCGDWKQSEGCKIELQAAKTNGLEVLHYEQVVK